MTADRLTAEERAEARLLISVLQAQDCGDNSCQWATARGGMRTNGGCRCRAYDGSTAFPAAVRLLVRALDALEATERERDEARACLSRANTAAESAISFQQRCLEELIEEPLRTERDTARAQVKTLAEAVFEALDTRRLHEDGCDTGKGDDRHCDCALSDLAYVSGWNKKREAARVEA